MRRSVAWLLLLVLSLPTAGTARASCIPPERMRFAPGASSTELRGGIPRGGRDCYSITARAGQFLSVSQPGREESNIVLQLYRPGWRIVPTGDGPAVGGRTLPGAGRDQDAPQWSGTLPVGGTYLLVLGTSWGGGEYALRVEVR